MKKYDVIIIGAGAGAKISRFLAEKNFKVAIIEKDNIGGTCLNRGCIPSKMLIHPADIAFEIKQAKKFFLKAKYEGVDFEKLTKEIYQITNSDSKKIEKKYKNLEIKNLTYYKGQAKFIDIKKIKIGTEIITAEKIIIGVGAHPKIPNIEGLKNTPFMTSTQALRAKKLPKNLVVLGGGYIGCELGFAYEGLGSKITFLARSGFLGQLDKDIRFEFTKTFTKRVTLLENVETKKVSFDKKINKFTIKILQNNKQKKITCDMLLVATGVDTNCDTLDLEKTKLKTNNRGFLEVNNYLETKIKGIYGLGDCVGNYLFRHSANFEAEYLYDMFTKKNNKNIIYPPMPFAVFTNPQIGGVGKFEYELEKEKIDFVKGVCAYKNSAMGQALKSEAGFVKLLFCKKTKKLLGAHIIGFDASTLIHIPIIIITQKLGLNEMLNFIYVHPALPEVIRNAVRDAKGKFMK